MIHWRITSYDSVFKQFVNEFAVVYASWILGQPVTAATPLQTAYSSKKITADSAFAVTLAQGDTLILHLEFQRRSTNRPMRFRMLEYMLHFAEDYHPKRLVSAAIYLGKGAGTNDTGHHEIQGLEDGISIAWHYKVIHLWNITAEQLLALGEPALLSLIPQTRMKTPARTMQDAVEQIRSHITSQAEQYRILSLMFSLLDTKEQVKLMEQLYHDDPFIEEFLRHSPWVKVIRDRESPQWLEKGRQEGLQEGIQQGIEQGIEQGTLNERCKAIADLIETKFEPTVKQQRLVRQALAEMRDLSELQSIFVSVARASNLQAVFTKLDIDTNSN